MRRLPSALLAVLTPLFFALAACQQPTHVEITPRQPVLRARTDTVQLIARVMAKSHQVVKAPVEWSSKNPEIAKVDEFGRVTAVASGVATMVARHGKLVAEVPVEISLVETVRSDVEKVELSYDKGDPMRPRIEVLGYDGRVLRDRAVYYFPQNANVCRVDPSGQFWPVEQGETIVRAEAGEKSVNIRCIVGK